MPHLPSGSNSHCLPVAAAVTQFIHWQRIGTCRATWTLYVIEVYCFPPRVRAASPRVFDWMSAYAAWLWSHSGGLLQAWASAARWPRRVSIVPLQYPIKKFYQEKEFVPSDSDFFPPTNLEFNTVFVVIEDCFPPQNKLLKKQMDSW